ncbi:MAG: hypothetical protein LBF68_05760 [Christensenellaceae bacterium]|jgi:hypothetical protein|nr:hypothetical protein [Christensenellaceae bacterium]
MLTKKNLIASFVLITLMLLAILTLTSCKAVNISIIIVSEAATDSDPFTIVFGENTDDKNSKEASYQLEADGTTLIENFTTGNYTTVTISRYGCTQVYNDVAIYEKKGSTYYFDVKLFDSSNISTIGTTNIVEYMIVNQKQLQNIALLSEARISIKYTLQQNIVLDNNFSYIPTLNEMATIDGANHTIQNLNLIIELDNVGLIGTNYGTIQNLKLVNSKVSGIYNVGALVGINHGIISNIIMTTTEVSGTKFVGSTCGLDYGIIENVNVSQSTLQSTEGYFGTIAGFSFTNIGLGAYATRPDLIANTPITDEMTALEILKTGIANWTSLPDRAKLLKGDFKVDLKKIMEIAAKSFASYGGSEGVFIREVLRIFGNILNFVTHVEAKLLYNDTDIENEKLGEAIGILSGYIAFDTENSTLVKAFDNEILVPVVDFLLQQNDIALTMAELKEIIFDNPQGGAAYYRQEDDYLQFTAAYGNDSHVDQSTGQVIIEFNKDYYTARVEEEIRRQGKIQKLDQLYIEFALDYIEEAKKYLFLSDFIDWENVTADMFTGTPTKVFKDGIYTLEFVTDPDKLMAEFVEFFNIAVAEFENIVISVHEANGLQSPVGHGSIARVKFDPQGTKPTIKAEVYDNGFIRYWQLDNFSVTVEIEFEEVLRQTISNEAKLNGLTLDISAIEFDLSFINPYTNLYSYSKSDSDIELQLTIFNGNEVPLAEALEIYRNNNKNTAENNNGSSSDTES